ncbi:MAG: GGDEF domain-containing protein [Pseudomonadota bacterium]
MEQIGTFGASSIAIVQLHLFRDSDQDSVAALLAPCPIVRLASGQAVEDTLRARLYIVLRGTLAVAADTRTGMADGTISHVLPGESAGEQAVLDDTTNLATMTALEETDLLVIEADTVWRLIDASNALARNLLRLLSFRIRAANAQLRRRQKLGEFYRQLSMVDGLTALNNRAWLNDSLPALVASAQGAGAALAIIMIDLDHFKKFNDTHGHQGGDEALRAAAGVIKAALRPSDFAVRYGGEEMMVILPESGEKAALMVANRLCDRLRAAVIFADMRVPMPQVTASFGVACLALGQDEQALVAAADAALYRAKEGGRNRVSM